MDYIFKRGSRLFLDGKEVVHLSDYSLSQTISERTITRNSLFKRDYRASVINRRKNIGSGSFSFHYSNFETLLYILSKFGFVDGNYLGDSALETTKLQISTDTYNIESDIILSSLDFQLTPSSRNLINVTFDYPLTTELAATPLTSLQPLEDVPNPRWIKMSFDGQDIRGLQASTLSITREINWTDNGADHFNLGTLAISKRPILKNQDIVVLTQGNKFNDSEMLEAQTKDIIIENAFIEFSIPEARITTRTETSQIFKKSYDIKYTSVNLPFSVRRK